MVLLKATDFVDFSKGNHHWSASSNNIYLMFTVYEPGTFFNWPFLKKKFQNCHFWVFLNKYLLYKNQYFRSCLRVVGTKCKIRFLLLCQDLSIGLSNTTWISFLSRCCIVPFYLWHLLYIERLFKDWIRFCM